MLIRRALLISLSLIIVFKIFNSSWKGVKRLSVLISQDISTLFNPEFKNLVHWVSKTNETLFVIPPNSGEFTSFRYFTKKSIWGISHDINQLAYSPDYYLRGFKRLKELGIRVQGLHKFTFNYNSCFLSGRNELKMRPVVFYHSQVNGCLEDFEELYRSPKYVVLRLK